MTKPWLQKYLKSMDIKPFKIKYYLEKKDPDFEEKMHDVLLVYKQVEMQFDENGSIIIPEDGHMTHTLSYDEKPGIQAVANKYPDHNPDIEKALSAGTMNTCGWARCRCWPALTCSPERPSR